MKTQRFRVVSASAGALGVVSMGLIGASLGAQSQENAPVTVLAPATGQATVVGDSADEVTTTTSSAPSFRPVVTATVPPPPTD